MEGAFILFDNFTLGSVQQRQAAMKLVLFLAAVVLFVVVAVWWLRGGRRAAGGGGGDDAIAAKRQDTQDAVANNVDSTPDRPVGFGYKVAWLAIKAADANEVLNALDLQNAEARIGGRDSWMRTTGACSCRRP